MVTSDPLISVQNLSYLYGDIRAIDSVNLSICPGEFIAIVGENGSGKTTLSQTFQRASHTFRGRCVCCRGKIPGMFAVSNLARDVGLVFQNPDHMFFADTVREEVEFGLKNIGIPDGDSGIDNALEEVGLSHTKDLYPAGSPGVNARDLPLPALSP